MFDTRSWYPDPEWPQHAQAPNARIHQLNDSTKLKVSKLASSILLDAYTDYERQASMKTTT